MNQLLLRRSNIFLNSLRVEVISGCCYLFCFVCLRPVSCVPNVASVSGLSILDCLFGFLQRLFREICICILPTKGIGEGNPGQVERTNRLANGRSI